jgi:hypothetical protein
MENLGKVSKFLTEHAEVTGEHGDKKRDYIHAFSYFVAFESFAPP